MIISPGSVQHPTAKLVQEPMNECRDRCSDAALRCSCTATQCQPLCDTCRVLAGLVPQILSELRRNARLYRWFLTADTLADLAQEVLAGLAGSGRPLEHLRGLIPCVARRRVIDRIRQLAARREREYTAARIDETPVRPVSSDLALALDEAIERMSKAQRIVFVARGIDGLTRRETARVLGVSEGTVQHHYMRALAIVADVLGIDSP